MEYQKMPPYPPAYSEQPDWNKPASAPPTELIATTPTFAVEPPPTFVAAPPTPTFVVAPPTPTFVVAPPAPIVINNNTTLDQGGIMCFKCNKRVFMRVKYHATWKTYCCAALLLLTGLWPCICLPCCCNLCYKTSQFCSNCNTCLGTT